MKTLLKPEDYRPLLSTDKTFRKLRKPEQKKVLQTVFERQTAMKAIGSK